MIRFVTFLVGLLTGIQPVELAVSGPVARIELQIDRRAVTELTGPPWKASVDLGPNLRPILLEALAFDNENRLLGRDRQWINMPHPRADAVLIPRLDDSGRTVSVRLQWSSAEFDGPRSIRFRLDGSVISHDEQLRVDVSAADPDTVHVLDADLRFPDDVVLHRQLVFGAGHVGEVDLDLTAVPIYVDDPQNLPPPAEMTDWFRAAGRPVRVTEVDRGEAQLIVVRGPSADDGLRRLIEKFEEMDDDAGIDRLPADVLIRVIGPIPSGGPRGNARLFPFSDSQTVGRRGLARELERARFANLQFGVERRADAVALAGLEAVRGNRRRGVLLVLGPDRTDGSDHEPGEVRAFLEKLRVPLTVFDLGATPASDVWRPVEEVIDPRRWITSVRWLVEDLEAQRIVWLAGSHLPSEITLGLNAHGIELLQ